MIGITAAMDIRGYYKHVKDGSEFRRLHIKQHDEGLGKSKNFLDLNGDLTPTPTLILSYAPLLPGECTALFNIIW